MADGDQIVPPARSPESMLRELRKVLAQRPGPTPGAETRSTALDLLQALDRSGVDGTPYVRYGMADLYATSVVASVLVSLLPPSDDIELSLDVPGWKAALAAPTVASAEEIEMGWISQAFPRLEAWSIRGPLDDVLSLTPPTRRELLAAASPSIDETNLIEQYKWIVDRTARVRLDRWDRAGLYLEYRWQDGDLPALAPLALMDAIRIDSRELNRTIAHDAVYSKIRQESEYQSRLQSGMQTQAKSFLAQQRYTEAGALFEYLISQDPMDADATNNLGFCILPIDAPRASRLFEIAAEHGYSGKTLLLYNRLCAERDSEQNGNLLLEIEHYWNSGLSEYPERCTIWVPQTDGSLELRDTPDVRVDLAREMRDLYQRRAHFGRMSLWSTRLEQVTDAASR